MKSFAVSNIADELGITIVSVSKALRDYPDISTETKRPVRGKAIENGLENIVHIGGHSYILIGRARRAEYETALRDHGVEPRDDWVIEGGFGEADGYRGAVTMIERGINPDAIFAVTFPVTLGVDDALKKRKPSLRGSTQIYSFAQHGLNRFFEYPPTSIHQPASKLGSKAMTLLLERITDGEGITEVELATEIIDSREARPPYSLEEEAPEAEAQPSKL